MPTPNLSQTRADSPLNTPLPEVETSLTSAEVIERLRTASKRGRLPGFESPVQGGDFRVAAHGTPFDGVVLGRTEAGRVRFEVRRLWMWPVVFAVLLVVSVWPGVYFVDKLIPGEWGWIPTWWWYVPLTALPAPFAWRIAMRRSAASIATSAREGVSKIAAELGGKVAGGGGEGEAGSGDQAMPR